MFQYYAPTAKRMNRITHNGVRWARESWQRLRFTEARAIPRRRDHDRKADVRSSLPRGLPGLDRDRREVLRMRRVVLYRPTGRFMRRHMTDCVAFGHDRRDALKQLQRVEAMPSTGV